MEIHVTSCVYFPSFTSSAPGDIPTSFHIPTLMISISSITKLAPVCRLRKNHVKSSSDQKCISLLRVMWLSRIHPTFSVNKIEIRSLVIIFTASTARSLLSSHLCLLSSFGRDLCRLPGLRSCSMLGTSDWILGRKLDWKSRESVWFDGELSNGQL